MKGLKGQPDTEQSRGPHDTPVLQEEAQWGEQGEPQDVVEAEGKEGSQSPEPEDSAG